MKFPSGVLVIVAYMVQTGSMKLFHRGRGLVLATLPSRFKGRANTALAALRYAQALLGPLLAGLRYGFLFGFASALLTVAIMMVASGTGWAETDLPIEYAIGVLLTGMVAGEFTDIWRRRITQMKIINEYQGTRLEEFVRNFHVLRVSHDQLAERLAANPHNLRDVLLALAERFDVVEPGDDILTERASDLLSFIFF